MIIDETHRRRETNTYTILDKCDMHAPYHNTYALKKVKEVVSERERETWGHINLYCTSFNRSCFAHPSLLGDIHSLILYVSLPCLLITFLHISSLKS